MNYYTISEINDLLDTKDNTLQYIEKSSFLLSSNTFCYSTGVRSNINTYIPSTLTNAVCRFQTHATSFTYTITYDSNMEINKTILFEPGKRYVISVNKTLILWQEVIQAT